MVRASAFAEWAHVHGNLYGTSLEEIEIARAEARGVLFDIDYQGARQNQGGPPGRGRRLHPAPSLAELERRLRGRGTEDAATAARRLGAARLEIEQYGIFDYVITNDDLSVAYEKLRGVVLAERSRRERHARLCERMLAEGRTST